MIRVCDATGKLMDPTRERAACRVVEIRAHGGAVAAALAPFCCPSCGCWHIGRHGANQMPGTLGEALMAAGVRRG